MDDEKCKEIIDTLIKICGDNYLGSTSDDNTIIISLKNFNYIAIQDYKNKDMDEIISELNSKTHIMK